MPQAISYVRFSSSKQAHGSSLQRQQEMQARWLEAHPDYTLSPLRFEDLGKSGWDGAHLENGFGKLKAAIDEGLIRPGDAVIVEAIDRAGRLEPTEMFPVITHILNAGISIHTLDDGVAYTKQSVNGHHLFLLLAKIQQANNYSETLSRRIHATYDRRKAQAKAGEQIKRHTPLWLTSDGVLIEPLVPLVKQAFEDYAAGLGERRIVRRLRESGHDKLATINGTTVKRWLRNPIAIGYWNDIPNVYPPVVEKELYYRVQHQLKVNAEASKAGRKSSAPTKYLITGLVKCGHCGRNFNVKKHPNTPATMQCTSRARLSDNGCSNSKVIPKRVLEYIRIQTSLEAIQQAFQHQQLSVSQKRLIELNAELENVSRQMSNLADAIAITGLTPELQEKITTLHQQRQTLEQEKLVLERTDDQPNSIVDAIKLESSFLADDPLKLNALLQSVGYAITCYQDGLIVVSGDLYPFQYLGVDRKTKEYKVLRFGEVIRLKMISPQLDALVTEHFPDRPFTSDSLPLLLLSRSGKSRADTE